MMAWTIDAALQSGCFETVVVSTDDAEIAEIATRCGASVPFLRSPSLADDVTAVSAVVVDALERLDPGGTWYSAVAQMMPTCPLRTAGDVRTSRERFEQSDAPLQISVVRFVSTNPWWALKVDEAGQSVPLFPDAVGARSQDLPELFAPTGAIWWAKAPALREQRTFHGVGRTCHCLPWTSGVDVDTEDDWALADLLMRLRRRES
jgi:pseudaminic acid cytidylyltransferase